MRFGHNNPTPQETEIVRTAILPPKFNCDAKCHDCNTGARCKKIEYPDMYICKKCWKVRVKKHDAEMGQKHANAA